MRNEEQKFLIFQKVIISNDLKSKPSLALIFLVIQISQILKAEFILKQFVSPVTSEIKIPLCPHTNAR